MDPIQQTLERIHQLSVESSSSNSQSNRNDAAYFILVQSSQSLSLRQALTEETKDTALYKQAGLRTPAENAFTDWFGAAQWWKRLVSQIVCGNTTSGTTTSSKMARKVIYVKTQFGSSFPSDSSFQSNVKILDLTKNPFGWDENASNETTQVATTVELLNSLGNLRNAIQQQVAPSSPTATNSDPAVLIFDSLTPLWIRHGAKVVPFLQSVQCIPGISTLLVHATDNLPTSTLRTLEDCAQALLLLHQGQALWMHQGVRERDNMVRKIINFTLQEEGAGGGIQIVEEGEKKEESVTTSTDEQTIKPAVMSTVDKDNVEVLPTRGRARVQLKHEEEKKSSAPATAPPATTGPRIFMQEDDPEFDDFDEEDPDDDLDI